MDATDTYGDRPLCNAPFRSLHLDPSGNVRVCELNSLAMLGNVTSSRLQDLWHGIRIERIRRALADHDLSVGCEGCASAFAAGNRAGAHAAYYDQFAPPADDLDWPHQLELSLSNACNLQCTMCNGDLSSAIRTHREHLPPLPKVYDDQFFEDLTAFLPHLERVAFIGGEPFLGAESLRTLDLLVQHNPLAKINVTTNGTVLTPRVESYFAALPIELCVSVDAATKSTYDRIRVGGDFDAVMTNLESFRRLAAHLSVSFCLMTTNWHEFGAFLRWADGLGLPAHINVVTAPARFSLYHLPAQDLSSVLASLEAEEATDLPTFGQNGWAWHQQLGRLRAHLVGLGRQDPQESQVALDPRRAHRLAARSADDRGVVRLHIGRSEQVLAISPDPEHALGMDLRGVQGRHLTELVARFQVAFGDVEATDLQYVEGGIEDRTMTFERQGIRTTLRAVLGPADADSPPDTAACWHLAATTGPAPPPLPTPETP